ncbi:MAG: hypothetical protein OZ922_03530 [Myxococcales bacterium]|nr:hypothetical protein [Myxococcales bacterium]
MSQPNEPAHSDENGRTHECDADGLPSRVTIERNGQEYLVTINGAVFVALSRAQAESIARRIRSPYCD